MIFLRFYHQQKWEQNTNQLKGLFRHVMLSWESSFLEKFLRNIDTFKTFVRCYNCLVRAQNRSLKATWHSPTMAGCGVALASLLSTSCHGTPAATCLEVSARRILKIDFVPQYSILSSTTMSSQTLPLMHITANLEWIRIDQVEKIDQLSPHQYIDYH